MCGDDQLLADLQLSVHRLALGEDSQIGSAVKLEIEIHMETQKL